MRKVFLCLLIILMAVSSAMAEEYTVPASFATIQAAIDSPSVLAGDKIIVGPGEHAGALVTKAVEIKGEDGATIVSGPSHGSGMSQGFRIMVGGGGCSINHLKFTVDLAVMNGAAQNDVTVSHCTFISPVQAVSNWRGSRWEISNNEIIGLRCRNGGGIGILLGDYAATAAGVKDNIVSHNKIYGTLQNLAGELGGYNGSGIVLYADFRYGNAGADEISSNRVVKNKIGLVSDTPSLVDVVAIELTDSRDDITLSQQVIRENTVGFNDLRETALQLVLTPEALADCNTISRNLGENRGHGLHPKAFGPGGGMITVWPKVSDD
jgi:hypothetical protein